MKQTSLTLIIILLSQIGIFGQTSERTKFDLAVKNVDIFDSENKKVIRNKTILIQGNKIASIIDSSKKFKAKKTIKGKGKLVVPGFIDTHTHILQIYGAREFGGPKEIGEDVVKVYKKLIARQYLNKGITTIVDMAQPEGWIEASLKLQKNPSPEFPNLFIAGSSTISEVGPNRRVPLHHEQVFSAEDGRKKVRKYAKLGIKHMKLYSRLKLEDMTPIVDEAKNYDITLNAHVDNNVVTIPQAMDLGVRNFEHFFTITPSILNFDKTYPLLNKKYGLKGNWNIDKFAANMVFFFGYIDEEPALKAKMLALFDKMAKEKVTISTALNVLASSTDRAYTFSTFDNNPPRNAPNLNYNTQQKEQLKQAFDAMLKYMKTAQEKGVKLRIGTDTRYGGKAFISELMLLSEGGFPIEDILQIATINGAEAMKIDDKFGSIAVGKNADLVIFDRSPFEDRKNFQAEKIVIKDGKLFKLKKSLAFNLLGEIEKKGINFSTATKIGFAFILTAIAFGILTMAVTNIGTDVVIRPEIFLAIHFFQAFAEVIVGSLVVAFILSVAPKHIEGFSVSLFSVAMALSGIIGAVFSTSIALEKGQEITQDIVKNVYGDYFQLLTVLAVVMVVIAFASSFVIRKMLESAKQTTDAELVEAKS